MSCHGTVDLSQATFKTLVGRRFKHDFSDSAFIAEFPHGEPVILASSSETVSPLGASCERRVHVHVPRLGCSAWIWRATTDNVPMITWTSEYEGHVNLANVEFTTLVGRRSRNDFSKEAHTCDLHHGERVVLERDNDRRVRVWVPRLDVLAWVWQRATDGTRLIKWSGDDEGDNHVVLRVTAPRTTSLAGKMWHRSVTFTEGQLLLGTSHESTDGARSVVLPSSNTEVRIMGSDVEPLAWPLHYSPLMLKEESQKQIWLV